MKIMSWGKIACCEKFESKGLVQVVAHLDIWNRFGNRKWLWYSYFNEKEGREAVDKLISSLKEHDIEEIPGICPSVAQKLRGLVNGIAIAGSNGSEHK